MPGNPIGSKTVDEILIVHIQLLGLIIIFTIIKGSGWSVY